MDIIEISFSLQNLPTLLASVSESLTLYLTGNRYHDSIGLVKMNPVYDQCLPVLPPISNVKPTLKRKAAAVLNSNYMKVGFLLLAFGTGQLKLLAL